MQVSIDHVMGSRENISEPIAQILQDNERRHFLVQSKVLPAKKCGYRFNWGSNPGPLACEASVITTTLLNLLGLSVLSP